MATAATTPHSAAAARPMTREEKKVILASSLGTVFEWYDFYLYGSLATIIGAQFFSAFDVTTRNVFALLAFAAGFLVRPFGAHLLRPHRRSRRPQVHLPGHDPDHGLLDLPGRPAAQLRSDRLGRTGGPDRAAHAPGPRARRRVRRRSGLCGRARPAWAVAASTPASSRSRRRVGLLLSLVVILVLRTWMGEQGFQTGEGWPIAGWRIPFLLSVVLLAHLGLDSSPDARIAGLQEDEGRGHAVEGAAEGSIRPMEQRSRWCSSP